MAALYGLDWYKNRRKQNRKLTEKLVVYIINIIGYRPTTTSGDTFSDGMNAGTAQGNTDAINGVDKNSCDVTIHSNSYCAGYSPGLFKYSQNVKNNTF